MGIKKTLGGDRLGSGRKMTQELHGFGRSSHNVSKTMRTDQAIGTIVPAWCQLNAWAFLWPRKRTCKIIVTLTTSKKFMLTNETSITHTYIIETGSR